MKIKYYGTSAGGGIPEKFCSCRVCEYAREHGGKDIRTRSQAVVDGVLSIDFPVDVFMHTVYGGLDMRKINHVLITHAHHDHFLEAEVMSRPQGMDKPVVFYGSEKTMRGLKRSVDATEEAYRTGARKRTCNFKVEVENLQMYEPKDILNYRIIPLRARHADNVDGMIFVIQSEGKSVLWAHDTGLLRTEAKEYLKNSGIVFDFVSLDCTLKRGEPITASHMDIEQCAQTVNELRENGNINENTVVAISHIGHLLEQTHEELSKEAEGFGMLVAYDGMTVQI